MDLLSLKMDELFSHGKINKTMSESTFIEKLNTNLISSGKSASTATSYIRYVRNLKEKFDHKPLVSFAWLKNISAVLKIIEFEYSLSTQTTILNTIHKSLLTSNPYHKLAEQYNELFTKRVSEKVETGEKTKTQEEYWMTWDDIVKRRNELKGINKVILSLYTMIPPGRAMEFATMELNGNNNSYEDGKFIIRHHKTSKKTGEVIINVPKELQEVLDEWLDGRKTGLLLGGLTAPSITKHLNTIFKPKKIGVSALRHLYLQKYSSVKKEMMNDSRAMRHSVGTAIGTYVK